ncbi:MAG: DUF4476 domain-containing protein [Chitinophagaceae bacterium]
MFKILLLVFSISISFRAVSQQDHFLYLQTDDRQPFYAKLSGQVHSSSENGYLIIPKLTDGAYQLDIGFARSAFPEQHFVILVNKKDLGFQIKNLGEKGWALYNYRTSELLASSNLVGQKADDYSGTKKTDIFSEMLANVVNDSAILYTAAKPPPPPKPLPKEAKADTVANALVAGTPEKETIAATSLPAKQAQTPPLLNKDSAKKTVDTSALALADPPKKQEAGTGKNAEEVNIKSPVMHPAAASGVISTAPSAKEKPFIIRLNESTSASGYQAIYLEQYNLNTDTVRISIPSTETQNVAIPVTAEPVKQEGTVQSLPQPRTPVAETETPVITPVTKPAATTPKKSVLQIANSDCKNFATDFDVDKLRVRLMTEYAIEDKLVAAKKVFKSRCFTVKQIRALTELFTSDETRYQFFDAAYPFVSDTSEFHTLESLILNDYYKNRFRAMVHQ